jgi:hypothetical protein
MRERGNFQNPGAKVAWNVAFDAALKGDEVDDH